MSPQPGSLCSPPNTTHSLQQQSQTTTTPTPSMPADAATPSGHIPLGSVASPPSATRSSQHPSQSSQASMTALPLRQHSSATAPLLGRLRLDILLANGQRRAFDFRVDTKVEDVREELWKTWPEDWPSRPASSSALRLLHLGHILSDNTILGPAPLESSLSSNKEATKTSSISPSSSQYRGLMPDRTTVVHLLVKGGWMSEEERMREEERERLHLQEGGGKKGRGQGKGSATVTTGGADGNATADGEHGGSTCCCVIC